MGWKGTMRTLAANERRRNREALRRQRALERQRAQMEKMQAAERAAYEVQKFENYIDVLQSLHKDCAEPWDWEEICSSSPPATPTRSDQQELAAQAALHGFKPGITDKLLKRTESKREELTRAVAEARNADEDAHQDALEAHAQAYAEWEATRDLASRILKREPDAFGEAITQVGPFSEIEGLGSSIRFHGEGLSAIQVTLCVNDEDVIPKDSKTLLKSGKLSVKPMTKTKFYELYQDYVCGCVLRLARELFALLPLDMTIITAEAELLNTQTGHMEIQAILSAVIPRRTIEKLNFELLDPSDSMSNFVHRMRFLKTGGFQAVDALTTADLSIGE